MKAWIWSAMALSLAAAVGGSRQAQALACIDDIDCPCGDVCSWAAGVTKPHTCVLASGGDPGWCGTNAQCLYTGQTCKLTSCTPAWSDTSVCKTADAGPDEDAGPGPGEDAGPSEDAGVGQDAGQAEDAGEGTGGTTAGAGTTGGTTAGPGTTGGTTAGAGTTGGTTGGEGTTDGTTGGTTIGGTSTGAGTTGGTTGGEGTSGGTTGGTTTGAPGPACTNDIDCDCGQVCSWANAASGCQTNCGNCADASGGDPGWCTNGNDADCLYVGQSCQGLTCEPLWSASSVCTRDQGTTGGTTGGGTTGGTTNGTSGGSTTGAENSTGGGTTGAAATTSGTTTGGETEPSTGGCSSAGGSFALIVGVLAIGLLTRKRKE